MENKSNIEFLRKPNGRRSYKMSANKQKDIKEQNKQDKQQYENSLLNKKPIYCCELYIELSNALKKKYFDLFLIKKRNQSWRQLDFKYYYIYYDYNYQYNPNSHNYNNLNFLFERFHYFESQAIDINAIIYQRCLYKLDY